jgi:Holliday junction DNA helicase RuvA
MIASIEGIVRSKEGNRIVLEVAGVGFEVFVPLRSLNAVGKEGQVARLETYLHVREDALTLYGFLDENEKRLFLALLGVSGVGPKAALAVLSVCEANELARFIHEEQTGMLVALPGIGKKTAERIILELKDKIDVERYLPEGAAVVLGLERRVYDEAASALLALGLSQVNAEKALHRVDFERLGTSPRIEDVVREALKKVSNKA